VILSHSRPPAAERTRTVLTHACSVVVDGGGDVVEAVDLMGVDHDGSLVMLIGLNSPLATRVAEHAAPCRVHAALVSPVPGPDRILDQVTVFGHAWLAADVGAALEVVIGDRPAEVSLRREASVLLRVKIAQLRLDGERVDLGAYSRAQSDPLAAGSDEFVEHLVRGHGPEVLQLAHLFPSEVLDGVQALAPVRVDRFGLTFRIDRADGSATARLNFATTLRNPDELPKAMTALQLRAAAVAQCPFTDRPRSTAPPP
jgi:hypothetical protein